MKNHELYQQFDLEIENMVSQNNTLRISDSYRLWVGNRRTILAWSNNAYDQSMENQFNMFDELLSSFNAYGGITPSTITAFNNYKQTRRLEQ